MKNRVVLVVSVWLRDNDIAGFVEFENKIAAIQAKHGGKIERAIRLSEPDGDRPFEVHVVSFPNQESLASYRSDDDMKPLADERERLIAKTLIVEGRDVEPYKPVRN